MPGNGIPSPETTRPKTPARYHWSLQRLEPERQSPPIRGYLPAARKSPQTRDCVVVSRGFELRVRHPLISSPSLRHSELLGSQDSNQSAVAHSKVTGKRNFASRDKSGANRRLAVRHRTETKFGRAQPANSALSARLQEVPGTVGLGGGPLSHSRNPLSARPSEAFAAEADAVAKRFALSSTR